VKKRTYIDTGVLIAAAKGTEACSEAALEILDDPEREFVSSAFVRLELAPTGRNGHPDQALFYEEFFGAVGTWSDDHDSIIQAAIAEVTHHPIAPLDALHISAAVSAGAEELVNTERPDRGINQTRLISVASIYRVVG
jgi:predicted nucleic acid-binding protein